MSIFQKTKILLPVVALALLPFTAVFAEDETETTGTTTEVITDEKTPATTIAETDASADNDEKIREMLFAREAATDEDFAKSLTEAKKLGASDQTLLEAEVFRTAIQNGSGDALALSKRLEAAAPKWDSENALGLRDTKTVNLFVHFLRAKDALTKKDEKTFRAEAAEAAWIEPGIMTLITRMKTSAANAELEKLPEFAALDKALAGTDEAAVRKAFADALWANAPASQDLAISKIQSWREKQEAAAKAQKNENLVLPLDVKLEQAVGEPVTLGELLKDKKAILLDFHASWCGPCMQVMPMLPKEAEKLVPQGVAVAALNTQDLDDAKKIQKQFNLSVPVLSGKGTNYSELLDVDSIPRYVLISAAGKVLFNGHPMDHDELAKALEKIGVKVEAPEPPPPPPPPADEAEGDE